ncbi:AraC family transcriptional regulator [Nocardioides sp. LMS-CY]|uniref:AraC family transcriptional regulator n=1 Tax=Nocardioides sp. (strain LMS-CY) TaxID=2840457 RepID=UPI001C006CA0|nr:AraC family transcriptional regulator [Nocardioides sp. LMS-CY]QWF20483.1 AraC family transcriptional regulator [Nocardioides sp. LMS-CY]
MPMRSEGRRYETTDPRAARDAARLFLAPHHLTVGAERERFRAIGDHVDLGAVTLSYLSYGAEVTIDRPGEQDHVGILVPLSGSALVRQDSGEVVARAASSLAAVTPRSQLHMRWTPDCSVLLLRAEMRALRELAVGLAPHGRHDDLTVTAGRVAGSEAAALAGVTDLLVHVLQSYGPVDALPGSVRRHLAEQALMSILLAIPNSSTSQFVEHPSGHRASVRIATDLLATETEASFTVGDLARAAGVGIRALELAFRRDLGTTPHAFVQKSRLEKARQELLVGAEEGSATVTSVAVRWGFAHVGRFARLYQQEFGVLPSQTLSPRR